MQKVIPNNSNAAITIDALLNENAEISTTRVVYSSAAGVYVLIYLEDTYSWGFAHLRALLNGTPDPKLKYCSKTKTDAIASAMSDHTLYATSNVRELAAFTMLLGNNKDSSSAKSILDRVVERIQ